MRDPGAEASKNPTFPVPTAKGTIMSLYELLHRDHEKVKSLFEQLEAAGDDQERLREALFSNLYRELDIHTQAEEKYFYSRLRGEADTREMTMESMDDHKLAKRLLGELDSMDKGTPEWLFKCRTLRDTVEGHVEMEEQQMFPMAQRILDDEEAAGIAEDIESFREEHSELEAF
jgi:hemerythrin superfamily protein